MVGSLGRLGTSEFFIVNRIKRDINVILASRKILDTAENIQKNFQHLAFMYSPLATCYQK
jgi:hypothetical protein